LGDETSKTISTGGTSAAEGSSAAEEHFALVIAWSSAEPHRIGEVALFPGLGSARTLGRGLPREAGGWVDFVRQRPGCMKCTGPLTDPGISRQQLDLRVRRDVLLVQRVGRCAMSVNGQPADMHALVPGDTLLLKGHLLLLCTRRPTELPVLRDFPGDAAGTFGEPDAFGILGESAAAWRLREQIAFDARADNNLLILGASGTGKELAARAVHTLSRRSSRPFVARNAATIPAGLVDAELFGNVKNYPNPGTPERPGLVAQADGGTLFLDEIGELPWELQAHLLRVLDSGGEYHRLGEALPRRADIRLVAATNRAPHELKHDLLARLTLRLPTPDLGARREDIPLLARHLLRKAAEQNPAIGPRFFPEDAPPHDPRIDPALVEHLLHRTFPANVRELETLLWSAMRGSPGDRVMLTDEVREAAAPQPQRAPRPPGAEPTADEIRESLRRNENSVTRAAQALGLPTRFVLYRLMNKLGIEIAELREEREGGEKPPAGRR
jgi:two-component system nitrogen regulation response regulator GlnG/two-component system response regulator HydG